MNRQILVITAAIDARDLGLPMRALRLAAVREEAERIARLETDAAIQVCEASRKRRRILDAIDEILRDK
jgi:hypothetical protein